MAIASPMRQFVLPRGGPRGRATLPELKAFFADPAAATPHRQRTADAFAALAEYPTRDDEWATTARAALAHLPRAAHVVDDYPVRSLVTMCTAAARLAPALDDTHRGVFLALAERSLADPHRIGRLGSDGFVDALAAFARVRTGGAALDAAHRAWVVGVHGSYAGWLASASLAHNDAAKLMWALVNLRRDAGELMDHSAARLEGLTRASAPAPVPGRAAASYAWAFTKARHGGGVMAVSGLLDAGFRGLDSLVAPIAPADAARVLWALGEHATKASSSGDAAAGVVCVPPPSVVPGLVRVVLNMDVPADGNAAGTELCEEDDGSGTATLFFAPDNISLMTTAVWACAACRLTPRDDAGVVDLLAQRVRQPHSLEGPGVDGGGLRVPDARLPLLVWSFHTLRRVDMCDFVCRQYLRRRLSPQGARVGGMPACAPDPPTAAFVERMLQVLRHTHYHHPEMVDALLVRYAVPVPAPAVGGGIFHGPHATSYALGVARTVVMFHPIDARPAAHALARLSEPAVLQQLPPADLVVVLQLALAYHTELPRAARAVARHAGSADVLASAPNDIAYELERQSQQLLGCVETRSE